MADRNAPMAASAAAEDNLSSNVHGIGAKDRAPARQPGAQRARRDQPLGVLRRRRHPGQADQPIERHRAHIARLFADDGRQPRPDRDGGNHGHGGKQKEGGNPAIGRLQHIAAEIGHGRAAERRAEQQEDMGDGQQAEGPVRPCQTRLSGQIERARMGGRHTSRRMGQQPHRAQRGDQNHRANHQRHGQMRAPSRPHPAEDQARHGGADQCADGIAVNAPCHQPCAFVMIRRTFHHHGKTGDGQQSITAGMDDQSQRDKDFGQQHRAEIGRAKQHGDTQRHGQSAREQKGQPPTPGRMDAIAPCSH
ncbi:hypothetical protein E4T56_gene18081, partial [Termitomyces sp. T112]